MTSRVFVAILLAGSVLSTAAFAQDKPAAAAPPEAVSPPSGAIDREIKGLSSESFPEREAALQRLQTLVAEQLKQRAQIQEILSAFMADLVQQQHSLAMVTDEEAQAQIAGLLEMERGLSGWTIQTMAEPAERRKALLAWGLTKENGPALARAYSDKLRVRLDGIKQVAKSNDDGATWTLARLINDKDTPVRAAAMAVAWSHKPNADLVSALWFRAVTGPMAEGDHQGGMIMNGRAMGGAGGMAIDAMMGGGDNPNSIKIDFPGGEPMEFDDDSEATDFSDSQLAGDVLVHLNSALVGEKVKALVEERAKDGKSLALSDDPDWTLVSHRLIETYAIKEAIPLLADEALGSESDDNSGDMNGHPFMWSRRTMAIGVLAKLIGKDPADFDLIRAKESDNSRGWMWAVEVNQQAMMMGNGDSDAGPMKAFYAFWKDHHAEFGVKEAPSNASIPQPNPPRRGFRGGGPIGVPVPIDGPVQIQPAPAPDGAPGAAPGATPDAQPGDPVPDAPVVPINRPPNIRPLPIIRNGAAG